MWPIVRTIITRWFDSVDIKPELIINWDHAGLNIIPVSDWTMAIEGPKRVEIASLGDKRQITAVFLLGHKRYFIYKIIS